MFVSLSISLSLSLSLSLCLSLSLYIYIGGWGGESFVTPTGKSFRFVRACERARRGEAVWASERRFDCVARDEVRAKYVLLLLLWAKAGPVGCPGEMLFLRRFYKVFRGQPF